MVSINNMHTHSGGNVTFNDLRSVELPAEMAEAIARLDRKLESGSAVETSEVRTMVTDVAKAVFVRLGADRIGRVLDGLLCGG